MILILAHWKYFKEVFHFNNRRLQANSEAEEKKENK